MYEEWDIHPLNSVVSVMDKISPIMGLGPMTLGLTPILDAINDVWKEMMDMISPSTL